jgi:branched-chain amino acid transport system substrate-binding protein
MNVTVFVRVACGVLVFLMGLGSVTLAQEPVKIGFAYVLSGRLAHYGFGAKQGAELAMNEINDAGGINGRKVIGIFEDTQLKPDVGVAAVRKLIGQDRVNVVMGIVSSGVADAVTPVVNELKTPLIITLAMTPDVTGRICNPYTFRVSINGPQNIRGAAILAAKTQAKRWTTMGPDYLFGYQCWEYFERFLKEQRQDLTFMDSSKVVYAPVTTMDFRPHIQKLMDSNPEGVLCSLYGGNLVDFVRQGNDMGLFKKNITFIMNLAYSADVMLGLSIDMPKGLWLGGLYWYQANPSPVNRAFVDAYTAKYKVFPDHNAHGAYVGVKAFAAAAKKAGSLDKQKIIEALSGLEMEIPAGQMMLRGGDHQAVYENAWGMSSEFDPKSRIRKLEPLRIFSGAEITLPVDMTGCHMSQ